jgi:DNA-binding transcriptional regulator YiaG
MTHSSLKERFAQRGHARGIDRVPSGSPVDLVLRLAGALADVRTIDATMALVKRGATMLKAKRTIEAMVEHGEAVMHMPTVESVAILAAELAAAGVRAVQIASGDVDVRQLRESLGLTQEQFALRFALDIATVQNWEQGRSQPDRASAAYLRVIARRPREAAEAQEETVG